MVMAAASSAQQMRIDASIGSKLTYTDNALYGVAEPKSDFILEVLPRVVISGEGSRVRLAGTAELAALTYAGGTRPSRLLPLGDLIALVKPVDNFLFVESELRSTQEIENAFGARSAGRTDATTHSVRELRISPYVESATGGGLRYGVRSDNLRVQEARRGGFETQVDAPSSSGYFGHHSLHVSQDPRPFGWRIEAERNDTRYSDSTQPSVVQDTARAIVDYALAYDLDVGVRAGYERNSFFSTDRFRPIYGLEVKWRPSARTNLTAFEEKRYFGQARQFSFDHRMRVLAWSMLFSRGTETATQGLFQLPATGNVAALLDGLFAARYPDPAERARQVQLFIAQQGLPESTQQPTNLLSQRLSLVTAGNASVALNGARNSLVLSGYYRRTVDAPDAGGLATGRAFNNNVQRGAELALSHRLTPVVNVTIAGTFSRIQALASVGSERTTEAGARANLTFRLSPKTSLAVGGSANKVVSNTLVSGHQISIFAGLDHAFY